MFRFLPGAGATEIELAQKLLQYADTLPGLGQYAVRKVAVALESIPRALADNSGANATSAVNNLYKAHKVLVYFNILIFSQFIFQSYIVQFFRNYLIHIPLLPLCDPYINENTLI